jgi:RHS repeat-associated protein
VVLAAGYDRDGNRTSLEATVNGTADFQNGYSYDALNEMLEVAQQGASGGNAVAAKRVDFTYNDDGQFSAITRHADSSGGAQSDVVASSVYGYDSDGRLDSLTYTLPTASTGTAPAYEWVYDGADRISDQYSLADTSSGATSSYLTWAHAHYNYDPAGQLTNTTSGGTTTYAVSYTNWAGAPSVGGATSAESYAYDSNGNRDSGGSVVSAPSSTTGDNQISSDGTYDYYYDNNGNLTRQVTISDGSEVDYAYDYRNRLTSVTDKDSSGRITQVVDYVYDAFNNLVGRTQTNYTYTGNNTTPASTTTVTGHFVYDGGNMVLALDNTGAVTQRLLWGPGVDQVLAEEDASGVVTWALTDNQNTVRDLAEYTPGTGGAGTTSVVDHRVYTAFGQPLSPPAVDFIVGYTGRYFDAATGLQWNLNRWYKPALQRWIGEDPTGLTFDANPYRYCGDGPVNAIDPSGLDERSITSREFWTSRMWLDEQLNEVARSQGFGSDSPPAPTGDDGAGAAPSVPTAAQNADPFQATWADVWNKYLSDLVFFTEIGARTYAGRSMMDPEIQKGAEYWQKGEYGSFFALGLTDSLKRATTDYFFRRLARAGQPVSGSLGAKAAKNAKRAATSCRLGLRKAGLLGATERQMLKATPSSWKKVPAEGNGWKLVDENGVERIRFMRPNPNGSFAHQKSGYWRMQNAAGQYLDEFGNVVPMTDPNFNIKTHIPYSGVR